MTGIDLNGMSMDGLRKLQKDVAKAINSHERRRRRDALAAVDAKARELGFTLSDLTGARAKRNGGKPGLPPRYRHPENPALAWSGRGRQPAWIREAMDAGKPLDEFLIGA